MTDKSLEIYREVLLTAGLTNRELMLILADSLEEDGEVELANAYRYAYVNHRWPFQRRDYLTNPGARNYRLVHDWEGVHRFDEYDIQIGRVTVTERSLLPRTLYERIRKMEEKVYGDVNDAFVLLGRALRVLSIQVDNLNIPMK